MELLITPEYHNLFPGEKDSLEDLLHGIPSMLTIQLIALIDATLHVCQEDLAAQGKLFRLMLERQPPDIRLSVLEKAYRGENRIKVRFFARHYNMAFIHYELTHFRDLPAPKSEELEPEQEFRLFKAYFLIAEHWANPTSLPKEQTNVTEDLFGQIMWPAMARQFDLNYHIAPFHFMTRGAVLLNTIKYHSPYSAYVDSYLAKHNKATSLNYVMDVTMVLSAVYESKKQPDREFLIFTLNTSPGFETLYEQFSLDLSTYQEMYGQQTKNFAGLKSKPLLRLQNDSWIVLNWDFLANKLYEGLFYDFYQQSGINKVPKFNQLGNFKSFVATEVTEKKLFRNLLKAGLRSQHSRLLFDDANQPNFPDAYYRIGNKVFLFELKDAAFPAAASESFDYQQIVAAIDQKINGKGKGTEQLLRQIELLAGKSIEHQPGYKHNRNLQIYPVIVFTDTLFNMPGVNYYVAQSFREKLVERKLNEKFRTVHPLTLINLNYLVGMFYQLRDKETGLDKLLEHYHHQIRQREKKHDRQRTMENQINIYDVFEYVVAPLLEKKSGEGLVKELFDALNLSEGLPKG